MSAPYFLSEKKNTETVLVEKWLSWEVFGHFEALSGNILVFFIGSLGGFHVVW